MYITQSRRVATIIIGKDQLNTNLKSVHGQTDHMCNVVVTICGLIIVDMIADTSYCTS